eukprot:UC4_evm1s329
MDGAGAARLRVERRLLERSIVKDITTSKEVEATNANTQHLPLRWGIMGAANIAKKNVRAIMRSPSASIVGVASRSLNKAKAFIVETNAVADNGLPPDAIEGYQNLLDRPDIDAVYLPLPTSLHLEWAVKAAMSKKHILIEKPAALNTKELAAILKATKKNGVLLMDGVMFTHHWRFEKIKEMMFGAHQTFGAISKISSGFSFQAPEAWLNGGNIRTMAEGDPLGCLGDLGWYPIRFALEMFQYKMPIFVRADIDRENSQGIPIDMTVRVWFDESRSVSLDFHCSFCHTFRQWIEVVGENAKVLRVKDFVISSTTAEANFELESFGDSPLIDDACRVLSNTEYYKTFNCSQETEMFTNFGKISQNPCAYEKWGDIILKTQLICDAAMSSARTGKIARI